MDALPENIIVNAQNPPFWVATHLYNANTYVIYRSVGGTIHKEIKVKVSMGKLYHSETLTPEELMYFRRHGIV